MTAWRLVRGAELVAARWRNGLGTSWEIAGAIGPEGLPLWQVSIAALEQDAGFSHYPHCDRVFTPLSGDVALAVGGGAFEARPLLVPFAFPGDAPTTCRVRAPGRAFNAIVDRRRCRVAVRLVRDETVEAERAVVHCVSGEVEADGVRAAAGDSLVGGGTARIAGTGLVVEVWG